MFVSQNLVNMPYIAQFKTVSTVKFKPATGKYPEKVMNYHEKSLFFK